MSRLDVRSFLFIDDSIVVGSRVLDGHHSLSFSLIVRLEFMSLRLRLGVFFVISVESRIEQYGRPVVRQRSECIIKDDRRKEN